MITATVASSNQLGTTVAAGELGNCNSMATISQSSTLQQGLVQGANTQSRSSDTTSNSVINSSSSAVPAQSSDQPWLDSTMSSWDKQSGSQPNTPRLDHANNPVSTSQFSGWGQQPFPSSFSSDAQVTTTKWTNSSSSNMQSAWGSQSPSLTQPQHQPTTSSSEWAMPGNASTTQWGNPSPSSIGNESEQQDSWGQPKRLPNTGTDGWGQAASSGQPNTPSSANNAPLNQWGQPTSHSSTSAWPTPTNSNPLSNQPPASSVSLSTSNTSANTASSQPQWGANSSAGQPNTMSPPSTTSSSLSGLMSPPQPDSTSTPTSWAGAAAKGLPKPPPKPQEPVDPARLAIEQSINSTEGWGSMPIRQDTSWGKPPEKNKQDESNQWHSTQNNGTAIWESAKNSSGQTPPADKSTWNQKVAGNNDPNVWNGEGSKGKDNALWDDIPISKESESVDQPTSWNSQGPQVRTISQSSGGESNSEPSWSSNPASAGINRSSPPNSINQQSNIISSAVDSNWAAQNGSNDPRKHSRWDSAPTQPPMRMNSMPADTGASGYWDQGQGRSGGPPSNWNSKPSGSWSSDNSPANWGQSQPGGGAGGHGAWGDGPSHNQWQSGGAGSGRKPSYNWDDNQANGGSGDFSRDRRMHKGESDLGDDADMGDWNESNSVWSSAGGFKQPRKHASIPESHMPPHMQPNSRMGGPGPFNSNTPPNAMHGGNGSNMNSNGPMGSKQAMIGYLMNMKYSKEEAHSALINNNMSMEAAIADLKQNSAMQVGSRPGDFSGMIGGPIGDNAFNPNIPPPNIQTNALNTPFTNNAQLNQSAVQGSSRMNKPPNQQRGPIGRAQNPSSQLVKQLEIGVQMNNIHPHILHLPLHEHNIRAIQQLLNLQQTYQQHHETLVQIQRRGGPGAQEAANNQNRMLSTIHGQMKSLQGPLLKQLQMPNKYAGPSGGLDANMAGLSMGNNQQAPATSASQSRLGIWTDKAPGSARQGGANSSLHASHSTPNLQGVLGENSNPWSSSGTSAGMWSNMSPSGQYLDNQNESHSANGPHSHSIAANSSQSFDIPEFVPGVPWQGVSSNKVEDDPNITPGSVARSLSVSTSNSLGSSGRSSTDLGWGGNIHSKSAWSSQGGGGDMWSKGGGTRPPPGFNKNMNRSMSMPQGPSENTSAFSPVGGGGWDSHQMMGAGSSQWLLLRNLPPQVDGNTLKTLCSQHGPLLSFFVNSNSGQALIRYATKEEGLKAQKSLNSCSLYETTISAEFVDESEVQRIIDQCQRQGNIGRSHSVSAAPGSAMWPNTNNNSGSTSNLWGGSGGMPSAGAGGSSTWGGLSTGGFLPTVDIGGNSFAM